MIKTKFNHWVGLLILLLALVTVAQGIYFQQNNTRNLHRQSCINKEVILDLVRLDRIATQDSTQLRLLVISAYSNDPKVQRTLADWLRTLPKDQQMAIGVYFSTQAQKSAVVYRNYLNNDTKLREARNEVQMRLNKQLYLYNKSVC